MKRKTFDVMFKRYGQDSFRACAGIAGDDINWAQCPDINDCEVAKFLEEIWTRDTEQEFKMTLTKKEKK